MTFRGLAVFSLATLFGSLAACRPSASIVRPTPMPPPLSLPAPIQQRSLPVNVLPPVDAAPIVRPDAAGTAASPWKPVAPAREWTSIVIHHTATTQGSVESIHEAHLAREWLGIGYHFVIGNGNGMPDGEIEPTFRWREQLHGAHAGSDEYNQHGIGIALIGNFDQDPPTALQLAAVKRLVSVLKSAHHIDAARVIGHGEVKATACPGKLFPLAEVSEVHLADNTRISQIRSASLVSSPHTVPAGQSVRSAEWVREPHRSAPLAVLSGSRLQ